MKSARKILALLLCLCMAVTLMPFSALALTIDISGTITGTATYNGVDVTIRGEHGVIISGSFVDNTVYCKEGALILGGNYVNSHIVDDGTGRYGLKPLLTNLVIDVPLSTYEDLDYAIMPYHTDFSFTLTPDDHYLLPRKIAIASGKTVLAAGRDYTYDSQTGAVVINGAAVEAPLTITAGGEETQKLWVNGEEIIADEDNTISCGAGTAVYDTAGQTLTLKNAELTAGNLSDRVIDASRDIDLKIVLEGANSISTDRMQNGIFARKSVTITGEGTLTVRSRLPAIDAADSLIIDGTTLTAATSDDGAIVSDGELSIRNGAVVHSTGLYYGLYSTGNLTVSESEVEAGATETNCNAITVQGDLTIKNCLKVTADSPAPGLYSAGDLTISNSSVESDGTADSGILADGRLTVDNEADVTANGNYCALFGRGGIVIDGAAVEAISQNDVAIFSTVSIELNGDIYAKGGSGYPAIGVRYSSGETERPSAEPEEKIVLGGSTWGKLGAELSTSDWFERGTLYNSWTSFVGEGGGRLASDAGNALNEVTLQRINPIQGVRLSCRKNGAHTQDYALTESALTFSGVTKDEAGVYTCRITMDSSEFLSRMGGRHRLAPGESASKTLALVYDVESDSWNVAEPVTPDFMDGILLFYVTEPAPSDDDSTYYTLTFESNGGTVYRSEQYVYGKQVQLDKTPGREGYAFTGWYGDKELKNRISTVRMTGSQTVYAGWRAITVPDLLNGDGHIAYLEGYPDGTVRPQAEITRAEAAAVFFRLLKAEVRDRSLTTANTFADVPGDAWYCPAVSTMAALGLLSGRSETVFDPAAPITRAEFAAICARFDSENNQGEALFPDIAGYWTAPFPDITGHWAEEEIRRVEQRGWVLGDEQGAFRPNGRITRAEAAVVLNRMLNRLPEAEADLLEGMRTFPDNLNGTAWYYLPIQEAANGHEYNRKSDGLHETWTDLNEV